MQSGEDKAWERLGEAEPDVICKNAAVRFDAATRRYMLASCGMDFSISPGEKLIESIAADGAVLLGRLGYFFRGSHVMPLDRVAGKYARDVKGFMMKGAQFGGTPVQYGDAAFALLPFPRIPVTIILWSADEEFDARVELLLDATCELQAPIDIIWSISMMSLLLLL